MRIRMKDKKIDRMVKRAVKMIYTGDGLYGYTRNIDYDSCEKSFHITCAYGRETPDGQNNFHREFDFYTDNKEMRNNTYFAGMIYGIMREHEMA